MHLEIVLQKFHLQVELKEKVMLHSGKHAFNTLANKIKFISENTFLCPFVLLNKGSSKWTNYRFLFFCIFRKCPSFYGNGVCSFCIMVL